MNTSRIRGFLIQLPKPSRIRVTAGDAEPQEIKPGRSYAKLSESIDALGVDLIECLDSEGAVLRALRLSSGDAQRSDAAEIPKGVETDPHALMLTHFANLIHRAYEHSTEIAFTRLVELAERMSAHTESIEARLAQTESALRRARDDAHEDALERAQETIEKATSGEGGDLLQQMAQAWMQGQFQSAAAGVGGAPKANGSNGKASNGKA